MKGVYTMGCPHRSPLGVHTGPGSAGVRLRALSVWRLWSFAFGPNSTSHRETGFDPLKMDVAFSGQLNAP
jgi:hypothetical protein